MQNLDGLPVCGTMRHANVHSGVCWNIGVKRASSSNQNALDKLDQYK